MAAPLADSGGKRSGPLTIREVLELPAMVDVATAGRALGFGRTKAYALARAGGFPCRIVRTGETYRVPTPEILAVLGIDLASVPEDVAEHAARDRGGSARPKHKAKGYRRGRRR